MPVGLVKPGIIALLSLCICICVPAQGKDDSASESASDTKRTPEPPVAPNRSVVGHADLKSAFAAASEDDTLVLLVCSSVGHPPSRAFVPKLKDRGFLRRGGRLHLVVLDSAIHSSTMMQYRVRYFPDLILMTPDGETVARRQGDMSLVSLMTWIEEGRRKVGRGEWDEQVADDNQKTDADPLTVVQEIQNVAQENRPDRAEALMSYLQDPRWQVRSAAAELMGSLRINAAAPALQDLLEDDDAFVVRTAIKSLRELKQSPSIERLRQLSSRLPELVDIEVATILNEQAATAAATLRKLFADGDVAVRLAILDALCELDEFNTFQWGGIRSQLETITRPCSGIRRGRG